MSIFSKLLAYVKGEISEIEAQATEIEQELLPDIHAAVKNAEKVFGAETLAVIQKLKADFVAGRAAGTSVGVLIPQLIEEGIKELATDLVEAGKNVLFTVVNLAFAKVIKDESDAANSGEAAAETEGTAV